MITILEHLKNHLQKKFFLPIDNNIYTFTETDIDKKNSNPLKEISISELQNSENFCFLNPKVLKTVNDCLFDGTFYKRDCDFIFIYIENTSVNIFLVECKSDVLALKRDKNTGVDKTQKEHALEQIRHSHYPAEYILKLLTEHFNEEILIHVKGLIFYTQLGKRLTQSASFLKTSGLPLPNEEEKDFDAKNHNIGGKFPVYSKKVSGSHTTHTFDDFLSYFKTA